MKTAIIQLDAFDNVISIKDKISWSKTPRILLVWPNKGSIKLDSLDILLILRAVEDLGAQISVVTDEPTIIVQLKELGISIFSSIPEAQKKPWRKPKVRDRSVILRKSDYSYFNKEYSKEIKPVKKNISKSKRWLLFSIGIVSILALVLFFIPSANIIIHPEIKKQSIDIIFRSNPEMKDINLSGAVPAKLVKIDVESQMEGVSSGIGRIPDKKSTGVVTFRNLSDGQVIIPSGTIIRTIGKDFVRFETLEEAVLEPGIESLVDVPIRCVIGGTIGNVPAGSIISIENELGGNISVTNNNAISGGVDLKTFSPTESDYQKLKLKILETVTSTAIIEIKNKYPQAVLIPKQTIMINQILSEVKNPAVGDPAERHTLTIRVEISAWIIEKENLEQALDMVMDADLTEDYKVRNENIDFMIDEQQINFENHMINWAVSASREIYQLIDENTIKQQMAGKQVNEALQLIQSEIVSKTEPSIQVIPSFWNRMPYLPFRISLVIDD